MSRLYALDVGGSHLGCALVERGAIVARQTISVPDARSWVALTPAIEAAFARMGGGADGLAIAFPALVDPLGPRVLSTPRGKYEDAVGFDFAAWAHARLGVEVRIELDGRMALLGERHAGALIGVDDAVLLALGTGIGTAALIGGALVRGRSGQASVLGGHVTVSLDGPLCICGNIGCAEAEASTWALPRLAEQFDARSLRAAPVLDFETVFREARGGDTGAIRVRDHCLHVWSVAALTMVHAFDPAVVLVTGGVLRAADEILPAIRAHIARHGWIASGAPQVVAGTLGSDAALLGAEALFAQPLAIAA